jgi:hypothetical protein
MDEKEKLSEIQRVFETKRTPIRNVDPTFSTDEIIN